jgi:hypothetical protein
VIHHSDRDDAGGHDKCRDQSRSPVTVPPCSRQFLSPPMKGCGSGREVTDQLPAPAFALLASDERRRASLPHPSGPVRTCPHLSAPVRTCPHLPAPARTRLQSASSAFAPGEPSTE